jgi:hypothetical protein
MRFFSKGDCNSHQTRHDKKKKSENWCVYTPLSLISAHVIVCTAERHALGRTGSGMRVLRSAETTGSIRLRPLNDFCRPSSFFVLHQTEALHDNHGSRMMYVQTLDSGLIGLFWLRCGPAVHIRALPLYYTSVVWWTGLRYANSPCQSMEDPPMRSSCLLCSFFFGPAHILVLQLVAYAW